MNRFLTVAAFAAAIILTGCSKDNEGSGSEGKVVEGVPTYATFSFRVSNGSGGATRAAMTDDGKESEGDKIKDIRILVFKTGASTVCEANELVDGLNDTKKSATVMLTSGYKRLFVIANAGSVAKINDLFKKDPTGNGVKIGATTIDEFRAKVADIGAESSPGTLDGLDIKELVGEAGTADDKWNMIMSNAIEETTLVDLKPSITANASSTAAAPDLTNNHFQITVQRTVAKGLVYYKTPGVLSTTDGKGKLDDLKYAFRNVNRQVYPFQRFFSDFPVAGHAEIPQSPFYGWTSSSPAAPAATGLNQQAIADANAVLQVDYAKKFYSGNDVNETVEHIPAAIGNTKQYYITENTSTSYNIGNTTYAQIQAKYIPNTGTVVTNITSYDALNNVHSLVYGDVPSSGTFYQLKTGSGNLPVGTIFASEEDAKKAAYCVNFFTQLGGSTFSAKGGLSSYPNDPSTVGVGSTPTAWTIPAGTVVEYPTGLCYFRLNMGVTSTGSLTKTYGVRRNNSYQAEITKFAGIGVPDPIALVNIPDQPLDVLTHVTATIKVAGWGTATSQTEL